MKIRKGSLQNLSCSIKWTDTYIMKSQKEEREKEIEILFNEIMVENFPILKREMYIQISESK